MWTGMHLKRRLRWWLTLTQLCTTSLFTLLARNFSHVRKIKEKAKKESKYINKKKTRVSKVNKCGMPCRNGFRICAEDVKLLIYSIDILACESGESKWRTVAWGEGEKKWHLLAMISWRREKQGHWRECMQKICCNRCKQDHLCLPDALFLQNIYQHHWSFRPSIQSAQHHASD